MADPIPTTNNAEIQALAPHEMSAETVDLSRYYRLDELESMSGEALEELWRACPDKAFYEQALEDALRMRFGSDTIVDDMQRLEVIHESIGYYTGEPPRIPLTGGWFKVSRRVVRHLESGAPLVRENTTPAKARLPIPLITAGVGLLVIVCLIAMLINHAARKDEATSIGLTATAVELAAQVATPDGTVTPTPLALDDIDRPIKAGDEVRNYYPVILEIQPANAPARVFPVQQKEVDVAQWLYASDPDVASAVLGTVIRPVLGVPYTPENGTFFEALRSGDRITLRMSTGSTLFFTIANISRVERQDTSIFSQTSPGLVITLLNDPAGDRLVIYGSYPAGQEVASTGNTFVGDTAFAQMGQAIKSEQSGITLTVLDAYTSLGPTGAALPAEWAYLLVDIDIQSEAVVDSGTFSLEFVTPDGSRYAPVTVDASITNLQLYVVGQIQPGIEARSTIGFLVPRTLTAGVFSLKPGSELSVLHTEIAFEPPTTLTSANLDVIMLGMETEGTAEKPAGMLVSVRFFNPFQQAITIRPGEIYAIFSPAVLEDTFPVGPAVQPIGADLPRVLNRGEAADLEFRFAWTGEPFVGLQIGGYRYIATLYP
jgi:hypothetical protein